MKSRIEKNQEPLFYWRQQYQLVKGSRELLLDFCATLPPEGFIRKNNNFGISSIRDLLVHIARSYQAWLGRALNQKLVFTPPEKVKTVAKSKILFEEIDLLMAAFIDFMEKEKPEILVLVRNGKKMQVPPFNLFSHVITHEFHHKGQILSLSRHLGHVPIDTDIII